MTDDPVRYLVGGPICAARPLPPFDRRAIDFLADLAAELRADRAARALADVQSFAFWCRRGNLLRLAQRHADGRRRLGLGLLFHIAPANVPVTFAYTFAFGLLAGNANLVRVPSRPSASVDVITAAINRLFAGDQHAEIRAMTAFLRSPSDNAVTERLSACCQGRVVWGGDATIRRIRQVPRPECSIEVAFADRTSLCVLDAPSIAALAEHDLAQLADQFFNDTYLMDQNACSSPHLVLWLGPANGTATARRRFWTALQRIVANRYRLEPVQAVDKYAQLLAIAAENDGIAQIERYGNEVYTIALTGIPAALDQLRGRFGLFFEHEAERLDELVPAITPRYQTLTYFGVDASWLGDFVTDNRLLGIDRIVPVGSALHMDLVWDGLDVVNTLSRIVDVR